MINGSCPISPYISNAFVHVSNLKQSTEWYSRLLSLAIKPERQNGGPIYFFNLANGTDLILDDNRYNQMDAKHPMFMLHTKNTRAALDYIQSFKLPIVKELYEDPMVSYFNFADPFGNVLMICGPGTTKDHEPSNSTSGAVTQGHLDGYPVQPLIRSLFVYVTDLPKAVKWYRQLLQLSEEPVKSRESNELQLEQGANIIIKDTHSLTQKDYHVNLMFTSVDIERAKQHILDLGIKMCEDIIDTQNCSFFTFEDPDQNILMVSQSKQ